MFMNSNSLIGFYIECEKLKAHKEREKTQLRVKLGNLQEGFQKRCKEEEICVAD